eukprot:GEMP01025081.1.p1 GENE.GEMP01025081.1~~GEMP01025081.1.p1  ORF type:complete len:422 (+),score=75.33 GEMP01025081.1:158-1423(+)
MEKYQLVGTMCLLGLNAIMIQARHWSTSTQKTSKAFVAFQQNYLAVVLLMKTADWLQGPYVYKLYEEKGFAPSESSKLFVAGFTSSAFIGVAVGSLADTYGRKKGAVAFTIFYCAACLLYHVDDFYLLLIGRVSSGIATSLLFSVFEAWYKAEHEKKQFDSNWVSQTFARQTFADGLLAIAAGLCASCAVELTGSSMAPFDMSAACLIAGGVLVLGWGENASESVKGEEDVTVFSALRTIFVNKEIVLCGLVQSMFGGSMYIFVYMWTPSLPGCDPGLVFSCFMVAIMIGTGIFQELETQKWNLVDMVCLVLVGASIAFAVPVLTSNVTARLCAFIAYEICVGIWFPSFHTLRLQLVPNKGHATILSFFRFPLNLIVICVILNSSWMTTEFVFTCCFVMMWIAIACILGIRRILLRASKEK